MLEQFRSHDRPVAAAGTFTSVAVASTRLRIRSDGTVTAGPVRWDTTALRKVLQGHQAGWNANVRNTNRTCRSRVGRCRSVDDTAGSFEEIGVGYGYACGSRLTENVVCWGGITVAMVPVCRRSRSVVIGADLDGILLRGSVSPKA